VPVDHVAPAVHCIPQPVEKIHLAGQRKMALVERKPDYH
jgi:hypothetical protein